MPEDALWNVLDEMERKRRIMKRTLWIVSICLLFQLGAAVLTFTMERREKKLSVSASETLKKAQDTYNAAEKLCTAR